MKAENKELVELALEGDEEAFGQLVRIYQNAVYATTFQIVGNFADAQDITQEVFVEAYTKLHQLRLPDKFANWLRSITMNTCRMWIRSRKSQPELEESDINSGDGSVSDESGLYEQLMSALTLLPEDQRTVIILHYIDDLSYGQIGKFLGIPVGTVRSRLHRAREKLKRRTVVVKEVLDKVKLDPDCPEAVNGTISELEEHIRDEERKLEADPENSAVHFELGCLYTMIYTIIDMRWFKSEKVLAEKALGHLEKGEEYGNGSAGAHLKMAQVYSHMGEAEKVREMVEKAGHFSDLKEEAEWINSIFSTPMGLATLLMAKGRYAEAEAKIKMSLELSSDHVAEAYTMMARANAGKDDTDKTIVLLKKALELSQANKDKKPKPNWFFPENSVDWAPEKIADYVRKYKEFDGIRKDPQFQDLLQAPSSA